MRQFFAIARTGVSSILLHPLRSAVTVIALLAVLVPYLVGLGISRGVQEQAGEAVRYGADLYVSGEQFGRPVPLPLSAVKQIQDTVGVEAAVPRIVGRIELGAERISAVLVGVPVDKFPKELECIDGQLYRGGDRNELVVGSDLARRLKLSVGARIPPFYRNPGGEHTSVVVGIVRSDVSLWQARLIVTSFETASRILNQTDRATDVLVWCRSGYQDAVQQALGRTLHFDPASGIRPRVVAREDLAALLPQGLLHRDGIFTLLFALAFAVAILVILVTSGFGLSERRRDIGILKATGWQTDQLLLRSLVESLLLSLAGAALAVVLAFVWLTVLNGWWIAGVFLAGVDTVPGFQVPFRLLPVPVLLAFLISFVVVMTGSLYSTWRAAIVPPRAVMR